MVIVKSSQLRVQDTFLKRLKGYMFEQEPQHFEMLLIDPCRQVHTFNMKFSLDIFYLDHENRIVAMDLCAKPNRIFPKQKKATKVIEMKSGLLRPIGLGDQIQLVD